MDFFETIRDVLIKDFMEKKSDLKERLELISKYSQNSTVKNLSTKKAIELRNNYNDIQIEEFKIELQKLNQLYF